MENDLSDEGNLSMTESKRARSSAGATFDRTGKYRYRLWRQWDESLPRLALLMLNPSSADAVKNDATITRCLALAASNGFGRMEAVNLFAYRTAEPSLLKKARDPIGNRNDYHILKAAKDADAVLLAWGNHGTFLNRSQTVLQLLAGYEFKLLCLGITGSGEPRHPLYIKSHTKMVEFRSSL